MGGDAWATAPSQGPALLTTHITPTNPHPSSTPLPHAPSYIMHKVRSAKRAARSELSVSRGEWRKHSYAESNVLSLEGLEDSVPRVHASVSRFDCLWRVLKGVGATAGGLRAVC